MTPPANAPLPCKLCGALGVCFRRVELTLGDVEIELSAPLCETCAADVPARVIEALDSPLTRSMLKVLGFDLSLAPAPPAGPPA